MTGKVYKFFLFFLLIFFAAACGGKKNTTGRNDDYTDKREKIIVADEKEVNEIIIPDDWKNIDPDLLPPWLAHEYGKTAFREKEYGFSLIFFRKALEKKKKYPEAEMWIGAVFQKEGEYILAEQQYKKAYAQKNYLQIEEDKYRILYRLASLYGNWERKEKSYQDILLRITGEHEYVSVFFNDRIKERIITTFKSKGINKVLRLYRINKQFPLKAHTGLGEFYFNSGRYWDSMLNYLYSVVIVSSAAIEEFRKINPQYEFQGIDSFLGIILNEKLASASNYISTPDFKEKINAYFNDTEFYKNLLCLGKALCAESGYFRPEARHLWKVVMKFSKNDGISKKADFYLNTKKLNSVIN